MVERKGLELATIQENIPLNSLMNLASNPEFAKQRLNREEIAPIDAETGFKLLSFDASSHRTLRIVSPKSMEKQRLSGGPNRTKLGTG